MITNDPALVERYATALLNVARRRGETSALAADSAQLQILFAPGAPLRKFIEGPQFTTEAKNGVIDRTLAGKADPLLVDLIRLLLKKGRVLEIGPILEQLDILMRREQGTHEASVATAVPLDESSRKELQAALEAFTKTRLDVSYRVDPALIGGVRFRYKDTLIDDTIAGKLDRLATRLRKRN